MQSATSIAFRLKIRSLHFFLSSRTGDVGREDWAAKRGGETEPGVDAHCLRFPEDPAEVEAADAMFALAL